LGISNVWRDWMWGGGWIICIASNVQYTKEENAFRPTPTKIVGWSRVYFVALANQIMFPILWHICHMDFIFCLKLRLNFVFLVTCILKSFWYHKPKTPKAHICCIYWWFLVVVISNNYSIFRWNFLTGF
jgi:hypothetical protein